jgi:hypothetical protein
VTNLYGSDTYLRVDTADSGFGNGARNELGYFFYGIVAGDLDGDGTDEIAGYQDVYGLEGGKIVRPFGNDVLGDWDSSKLERIALPVTSDPRDPTLCLANLDDDSLVVEYEGVEMVWSNPVAMAFLASPPYWAGFNDDGSGQTTFGHSSGVSSTAQFTFGVSVGASVGFDLTVLGTGGSAKASIEQSVNASYSYGVSFTENVAYKANPGEDKVVFTSIPYDLYSYSVLSSPTADFYGEAVGEMLHIMLPRKPAIYQMERQYFNDHNGDGYDIPATTASHTLGDPLSYPSEAERNTLQLETASLGGLFSSYSQNVGVGDSSTVIGMQQLTTETTSLGWETKIKIEATAQVAGAQIGGSVSASFGASLTNTVTEGTSVEGSVPDISTGDFSAELGFHWGLMAYPVHDVANEQGYSVITYWVESNS